MTTQLTFANKTLSTAMVRESLIDSCAHFSKGKVNTAQETDYYLIISDR